MIYNIQRLSKHIKDVFSNNLLSGYRYELCSDDHDSFDSNIHDVIYRAKCYSRYLKVAYKSIGIAKADRNALELYSSSGVLSMLLVDPKVTGFMENDNPGNILRRVIGISKTQTNVDFANQMSKIIGTHEYCRYINEDIDDSYLMEDIIVSNNINILLNPCINGEMVRMGINEYLEKLCDISSVVKVMICEVNWDSSFMKYNNILSLEDFALTVIDQTNFTDWYYISSIASSNKDIVGFLKMRSHIQNK